MKGVVFYLLCVAALIVLIGCSGSSIKPDKEASPQFFSFEGRPFDIAAADLKGRGIRDVIIAVKYTGLHIIAAKDGGLDFGNPVHIKGADLLSNPLDLDTGDFNGDGIADIAYATEGGVQILINSGDGINYDVSLALNAPKMSFNLKAVDLNKDGISDIVTGGTLDDRIFIYLSKAALNYDLLILKPKSTNDSTPFSMQQKFTAADVYGDGYPCLLIPEYQNSVLWLVENKEGREFVPLPIYSADFNHKIQYALMLYADESKAYIAVAAGTFKPVIDIIAFDKGTKTTELLQQIPLEQSYGTPVHIEMISGSAASGFRLVVTSHYGISLIETGLTYHAVNKTYPIQSWLQTVAVMSMYYPEQKSIFTAVQKKDGVFIIPFENNR